MRVAVALVTHGSAAVIGAALRSIPAEAEVVVVDNASTDDTLAEAAAARPSARLHACPVNRGFGAGCNIALAMATREFTLLLNPDARLAPETLAALVEAADAYPEAGIIAPLLLDDDAAPVRSWNVDQRRRQALPRDRRREPWPEGPLCVDSVSGACMLLRNAHHLRFDEGFFLYYEDDDLCAGARAAGHTVLLVPEARIGHAGGGSSAPSRAIAWRKAWHMAWSRLHYQRKHAGVAKPWQRLLHHAGKAVGHGATFAGAKLWADMAGFCGTLAWMRGQPAAPEDIRA